jgi:hypothetical protein
MPGISGLRAIRTPAYLVLTMAMVLPLLDYANGLLPLNLGDAIWRFGAVSLVASYAVATTAQLLFIMAIAAIFGDRRVLITVAIVAAVIAVTLLGVLGLYALDALQARSRTSDATQRRLEITAALVVLKLVVLMAANTLISRFGWRESRRARPGGAARPEQLIVPRKSDSVAAQR